MTIRDLYNRIESWPEDTMDLVITDVFSWRGIYAEPCCSLEIGDTYKSNNLNMLKCLVTKVFRGYKGGAYTYDWDDEIHFELDQSECTSGNYILKFLARNHSNSIKHIFG